MTRAIVLTGITVALAALTLPPLLRGWIRPRDFIAVSLGLGGVGVLWGVLRRDVPTAVFLGLTLGLFGAGLLWFVGPNRRHPRLEPRPGAPGDRLALVGTILGYLSLTIGVVSAYLWIQELSVETVRIAVSIWFFFSMAVSYALLRRSLVLISGQERPRDPGGASSGG